MTIASMAYNKQFDESLAERRHHMVDFDVELVSSEQRPPPNEDGMGNLENTSIDLWVGFRESTGQILVDARFSNQPIKHSKSLDGANTVVRVSHLRQKSESAMTLMASPNCAWTLAGEAIMRPTRRSLMICTSS